MPSSPVPAGTLPRIFLARHCTTDWNAQGRLQGSRDLPLNVQGRSQARALLPLVSGCGIQRIYSSPYLRALQTARIYAEHLAVPVVSHPGLRELDHGDWEGAVIADLLASNASGYRAWLEDATRAPIPGGELIETAQARIVQALAEILITGGPGPILVVTHKHIRALLMCRLNKLPLSAFGTQIVESQAPSEVPEAQLSALLQPMAAVER